MKKQVIAAVIMMFLIGLTLSLYNMNKFPNAYFDNGIPTIGFEGKHYKVSSETIDFSQLNKKVAKVTSIGGWKSYTDKENPYKDIGFIWSIQDSDNTVALEMNGQYYRSYMITR